jgi:hypothetical protein
MGYTTEFFGEIAVEPPLSAAEIAYLRKFSKTRRMKSALGPYYVDRAGDFGQAHDDSVLDYNTPPDGQPGLWCQWVPTKDGSYIEWNEAEKFYTGAEWMKYLIEHFIGQDPLAQRMPFLTGHTCNGEIEAQGEDSDDRWKLIVKDNRVYVSKASITYGAPEEV